MNTNEKRPKLPTESGSEVPKNYTQQLEDANLLLRSELKTLHNHIAELEKPFPTNHSPGEAPAFAILYDDPDHKPEYFCGAGAEEAARSTFQERSSKWSCYLFVAETPSPTSTKKFTPFQQLQLNNALSKVQQQRIQISSLRNALREAESIISNALEKNGTTQP